MRHAIVQTAQPFGDTLLNDGSQRKNVRARPQAPPKTHGLCLVAAHGMSLIELVVVISLVALLMALIIPAVAKSRAVADQVRCQAHLSQIGISLANYESSHRLYPYLVNGVVRNSQGDEDGEKFFSVQVHLLPYLEQVTVYNTLNFSVPGPGPNNVTLLQTWPHPANTTGAAAVIETFLCPADPSSPTFTEIAGTNYRTNIGVTVFIGQRASILKANGAFVPFRSLRPADFTDGLSHTAMFSEKPRGTSPDQTRFNSFVGFWESNLFWTSLEDMVRSCSLVVPQNAPFQNRVGYSWLVPGYRLTWYNHNSGPNGSVADCTSMSGPGDTEVPFQGCFSARSYHEGGVNTLFGDGRVRLVSNSTDLTVWRALGTRAGGESVDLW